MSTEEMTRRLKEELICSICLGYFSDPVSIHCGHTFCRACITKYWHWMKKNHFHCPRCRATSRKKILKPNRELRNIAEIVPKLNEKTEEKGKMRGRMCQRHQEPLKLFCKNDRMAICMVCDKSREHKDHMMFPVEEAILEYEQEFQDQLVSLKKEKEKLLTFQAVNSARSEEALLVYLQNYRKNLMSFQQILKKKQSGSKFFLLPTVL
ncbi:E3 ubiquitin-protein ligase TRIM17-like [Candoia aspera]|uniref:E3 ubiquitin-protein ligase TRIM17-like n=1 Tax=Candoia aspera TaxID=51853 RepID=UPI002FD7E2EB